MALAMSLELTHRFRAPPRHATPAARGDGRPVWRRCYVVRASWFFARPFTEQLAQIPPKICLMDTASLTPPRSLSLPRLRDLDVDAPSSLPVCLFCLFVCLFACYRRGGQWRRGRQPAAAATAWSPWRGTGPMYVAGTINVARDWL